MKGAAMADENLVPEGAEGEVVQPENVQPEQEEQVTPESLAAELGWAPKDQWRGDEAEWKSAAEFLKETVSVNKTTRKALKNIEDRMARMTRASETMIAQARADERAKVEAEFNAAVDDGDHDRARKASAQLQKLSVEPDTDAAVPDFAARNASWWQIDPLATQMAVNVSNMAAGQGKSPEEQCKMAEDAVRKRFPEYFETEKPKAKAPAEVAEQQGRTARTQAGNRKRGYSDLPPEAKAVAVQFEKQGLTKEAYAESYWKENA